MSGLSESTNSVTTHHAFHLVAAGLLSELDPVDWLGWEDVPDICEEDFERVVAAAKRIMQALAPNPERLKEAHLLLEARCDPDAC